MSDIVDSSISDMVDNNSKNEERKKLLSDLTYTFFVPILNALRSIVIIVLISKKLGALEMGLWGQIMATLAIGQIIGTLNLGHCMSRFLSSYENRREIKDDFYSVIFIVGGLSLLLVAVGLFFSKSLSDFLFGDVEYYKLVFCLFGLTIVDSIYAEQIAFLRAVRLNKKWAILTLWRLIIDIPVLVFCIVTFHSVFYVAVGFVIVEIIFVTIIFKAINETISGFTFPRFKNMRNYFSFGLPLLPAGVSYWVITMSGRYFIKFFLDVKSVGIYSVAWSISNIFVLLLLPITSVLFPDLSKLYDLNMKSELEKRFITIVKYFFAIEIGVISIVAMLSDSFIFFLSKKEFSSGTPVLIAIIFAILLYGLFELNSVLINVLKATRFLGLIWVLMGVLSIVLNRVLIPYMGIIGAGISCILVFIFGLTATSSFSSRRFDIMSLFKKSWFFKPLICGLIVGFLVKIISFDTVGDVLLIAPLGFVLYAAILFLLGFGERKEIELVISMIEGKIPAGIINLIRNSYYRLFNLGE